MYSFAGVGGTLMTAGGEAVLGHVVGVRVGGVPGTFECQPDVPVERGTTYALGIGECALVVRVEDCWVDASRRRYAHGRVLRRVVVAAGSPWPSP